MKDQVKAGSILMEEGTLVPDSVVLDSAFYSSGWGSLRNLDGRGLERELTKAGWNLFFMAGQIKRTVFGFDLQKTIRTAVKRLIAEVTSQRLNCVELSQVTTKSFLGVFYVTVCAHSRHIQKSSTLVGAIT